MFHIQWGRAPTPERMRMLNLRYWRGKLRGMRRVELVDPLDGIFAGSLDCTPCTLVDTKDITQSITLILLCETHRLRLWLAVVSVIG